MYDELRSAGGVDGAARAGLRGRHRVLQHLRAGLGRDEDRVADRLRATGRALQGCVAAGEEQPAVLVEVDGEEVAEPAVTGREVRARVASGAAQADVAQVHGLVRRVRDAPLRPDERLLALARDP